MNVHKLGDQLKLKFLYLNNYDNEITLPVPDNSYVPWHLEIVALPSKIIHERISPSFTKRQLSILTATSKYLTLAPGEQTVLNFKVDPADFGINCTGDYLLNINLNNIGLPSYHFKIVTR